MLTEGQKQINYSADQEFVFFGIAAPFFNKVLIAFGIGMLSIFVGSNIPSTPLFIAFVGIVFFLVSRFLRKLLKMSAGGIYAIQKKKALEYQPRNIRVDIFNFSRHFKEDIIIQK